MSALPIFPYQEFLKLDKKVKMLVKSSKKSDRRERFHEMEMFYFVIPFFCMVETHSKICFSERDKNN